MTLNLMQFIIQGIIIFVLAFPHCLQFVSSEVWINIPNFFILLIVMIAYILIVNPNELGTWAVTYLNNWEVEILIVFRYLICLEWIYSVYPLHVLVQSLLRSVKSSELYKT